MRAQRYVRFQSVDGTDGTATQSASPTDSTTAAPTDPPVPGPGSCIGAGTDAQQQQQQRGLLHLRYPLALRSPFPYSPSGSFTTLTMADATPTGSPCHSTDGGVDMSSLQPYIDYRDPLAPRRLCPLPLLDTPTGSPCLRLLQDTPTPTGSPHGARDAHSLEDTNQPQELLLQQQQQQQPRPRGSLHLWHPLVPSAPTHLW